MVEPAASAAPARPRPRPAAIAATLVLFACVFIGLELPRITGESATFDEPGNLLAGYAALARGDYRPAIEHPPVARLWAALPLLGLDVRWDPVVLDRTSPAAAAMNGPFELGHRFLYRDNDADRLLVPARVMVVLLGVALGCLVFAWATEWLGFRAGVIALGLYTLEPEILAHAGLVTTDLAVTLFFFGAVYAFWRALERVTPWNVAGLACCCAGAVLSKFSGLLLGPALAALAAIAIWRDRRVAWRQAAGVAAIVLVAMWASAWAVYGFRFAPSDRPDWQFSLERDPAVQRVVPVAAAAAAWSEAGHLLPNALVQGFLHGQGLVQGRPAFLAGQYSEQGWWYYFPAALLMKTPLAVLGLLAVGGVACARLRRRDPRRTRMCLVLPAATFLAISMTSSLAIGVRHILPVVPFVVLVATLGAETLLSASPARRGRLIVAAAFVLLAFETGRAYPHPLAFFNAVFGGPSNGFRYLADSNLDWGQDLKGLRRWMDRAGIDHVNLAYFGTADPTYYGISCTPIWGTTVPGLTPEMLGPPRLPGYVAISATLLDGVPFDARTRDFYRPLRDRAPVADIGGSIKVYRVEEPWWK